MAQLVAGLERFPTEIVMFEVDVGINTALTGDTALMDLINSVHHDIAPGTATWPVVIFRQQSGFEENALSGRVAKTLMYQVQAVAQDESANAAQSIDNRVRTVLNRQSLTISGWRTIHVKRDTDINYREVDGDGKMYQYVGGVYEIKIAPS
jgi:hypothetical protein